MIRIPLSCKWLTYRLLSGYFPYSPFIFNESGAVLRVQSTARGQWQTIKIADYFETCSVMFLW